MWLQQCLHPSKRNIIIAGSIAAQVAFKKCAPFSTENFRKIDETTMDDAEDSDYV